MILPEYLHVGRQLILNLPSDSGDGLILETVIRIGISFDKFPFPVSQQGAACHTVP